jgi:hypothetical protein
MLSRPRFSTGASDESGRARPPSQHRARRGCYARYGGCYAQKARYYACYAVTSQERWFPSSNDAEADADAIEERAGLAADRVPAVYLDAWARLQCQRPLSVADAEWRLAVNDAGLFLDAWGEDAATLGWTSDELFDVTAGLVWRLGGERIEALEPDRARLRGGRTLKSKRTRQ